ncbi:MAG: hypothetical protein ABFE08_16905 [Armatimonadia bacterium]
MTSEAKRRRTTNPSTFNWRLLIAAGSVTLLLALWMQPGNARPVQWDEEKSAAATVEKPATAGPARVSVLDLIGKVSLAVLLVYGLSFGLAHARKLGFGKSLMPVVTPDDNRRLQLCESLALGKLGTVVHLIEVDGKPLVIGACAEQLFPLWQAPLAAEDTSSFRPVKALSEAAKPTAKPSVSSEQPLFQHGFGQPARAESDWAQQRTQLISSLLQSQ